VDPKRDKWATKIRPALRKAHLRELVEASRGKLSRRAIIDMRAGRSRPHRKNEELLRHILFSVGFGADFLGLA
jgi:hypothetical protein